MTSPDSERPTSAKDLIQMLQDEQAAAAEAKQSGLQDTNVIRPLRTVHGQTINSELDASGRPVRTSAFNKSGARIRDTGVPEPAPRSTALPSRGGAHRAKKPR